MSARKSQSIATGHKIRDRKNQYQLKTFLLLGLLKEGEHEEQESREGSEDPA
jgi:hypothetical protein